MEMAWAGFEGAWRWRNGRWERVLDLPPRSCLLPVMNMLPRLLRLFAVLAASVHAAAEDANLKYFRDLAETRNYSLGRPVAPKLTPDGQTVIYLRGGPRDPVLRLYQFPLPAGPERELLTPAQLLGNAEEKLSAEEKAPANANASRSRVSPASISPRT